MGEENNRFHPWAMQEVSVTAHAKARMQQRAISSHCVKLLLSFGRETHANGAVRYDLDGTGRRLLEECVPQGEVPTNVNNAYAVVNGHRLITVGHRTQKFRWS